MQKTGYWLFVFWVSLSVGCGFRIYPPIAMLERTATIYPEPRPKTCNLMVLNGPPTEPYQIFAQVVSYAGSAEMAEKMQRLIKENACEAGADAIVLLPMQRGLHINTEDSYPDWVVEGRSGGQGDRSPHWVDKRYSVSQRALALIFKKNLAADSAKPGS